MTDLQPDDIVEAYFVDGGAKSDELFWMKVVEVTEHHVLVNYDENIPEAVAEMRFDRYTFQKVV